MYVLLVCVLFTSKKESQYSATTFEHDHKLSYIKEHVTAIPHSHSLVSSSILNV